MFPRAQRVTVVFLSRKAFSSQPVPSLMDVWFTMLETLWLFFVDKTHLHLSHFELSPC